MRSISSATQAHLEQDSTNLAMCWRVYQNRWQPQITGISSAGIVSTLTPHLVSKGDTVFVSDVFGATSVNDSYFQVASVLGTKSVLINASVVSAYTSGGELHRTISFTEHNQAITIGNVAYEATDGMAASKLRSTGSGVANLDVTSLLDDDRISVEDLLSGLYDNAHVDIFVVNYLDTTEQIDILNGNIGEIDITDTSYTAEVRDYVHILQNTDGEVYTKHCRATLGDTKCGVDLGNYQQVFIVASSISQNAFEVIGLTSVGAATASTNSSGLPVPDTNKFTSSIFKYGEILWYTGNNSGYGMEIIHTSALASTEEAVSSTEAEFVMLSKMPTLPVVGEIFIATQGCDKSFDTCKTKYSNGVNFRGEPFVPTQNDVNKYGNNT